MALNNTKVGFKAKFSDFLLWSGIIIAVIAIITEFITVMLNFKSPIGLPNIHHLIIIDSALNGLWLAISTFTIQSNILVLFFFFAVLLNRFYEKQAKFIHGRFSMAIATYISVTLIVFFAVLFKPMLNQLNTTNPFSIILFSNSFLLHLIIPIILISYYLLNAGITYWGYKTMVLIYGPITILYMLIYLGYVLLKGTYIGMVKDGAIAYSYPYPFLNIKDNLNTFFIYFSAILVLVIILIAIYTFYNNYRYKRIHKAMANQ